MRRLMLLALAVGAVTTQASAQERPSLPRGQDPNDWEAYYSVGVEWLGKSANRAEENFAYASHLRPDRAEPLYGQWLTFWAHDLGRFEQYLRGDERTLKDPQVIRAESLRVRAFRRNPFVHQGLIIALYNQLPGQWRRDPVTHGWLLLGQAHLEEATARFGSAIDRDPRQYGYLRFVRASAFVNSGHADSATTEISKLLAQLRAEDAKSLGTGYESKELLEYAMGLLQLHAQRTTAAREAFGRAVVENAALAPAHAMLGELAVSRNDTATALLEYGLAAETDPGDVEVAIGFGNALRQATHLNQAIAQFRKAIALEPLYATPYFLLGMALDELGDRNAGAEAYKQFLSRAPASDPRRTEAEHKLTALDSR
jgi:tetratricopeptide (TPR) repeat protein